MCGILVSLTPGEPGDPSAFKKALDRLAHRGPDGEGLVSRQDGALLLGHRRLSIFDPSDHSRQPMVCPETGNTLVFNGSIYNHPELRSELAERGHRFRTDGDTEVILAAWRQWGRDCFARFNGAWAVALYEHASRRLFLCRDRLGVRPLFVLAEPGRLVAASEIRAVVAIAHMKPRVDSGLALDFLVMGMSDHENRTMVQGIGEIAAGTLWEIGPDLTIRRHRYHHWPDEQGGLAAVEAAGQIAPLFEDAVKLRLRSDVPVAAQLSGGLDSGSVAWAIGRADTLGLGRFSGFFTYGYTASDAAAYDERSGAALTHSRVARHLPLHQVTVAPVPSRRDLDDFLAAQELPVNTPSPVAGLRLFRAMRGAGATVALTGDGSDEIWTGYTQRYLPVLWRDQVLAGQIGAAWDTWRCRELPLGKALGRLSWSLPSPLLAAMVGNRPHVGVLTPQFRALVGERLPHLQDLQREHLHGMARRDVESRLLPHILRLSDRNAMACGMECRSPFLDHRLVDLALRLPTAAKIDHRGGKLPLRMAMRDHLPDAVTAAAKTRGLGHAEQFLVGHMDLDDVLNDPPDQARDFVDVDALRLALRRFPANARLWWPVCFLLWLRQVETHWPRPPLAPS